MQKIWKIRERNPAIQAELSDALKISKITAQLLANRGINSILSASKFLSSSLSSCHDPFLLKDMGKAVMRIKQAINLKEKITVYGDYDVDGLTGVSMVCTALRDLGGVVSGYIPNRVEEGYGLNQSAIKKIHADGSTLIVTTDCGITSFKEVEFARSLKIDIIITDHHEILESRVPSAFAVINPLQPGCDYPFKHLAGVGISYKLVKALYVDTPFFAEDYLDLVSLGTVADMVPLVGENRVLAKYGLEELSVTSRMGLKALIEVSGLSGRDISCGHIGFMLGPRINAMGRTGSPEKALELLLSRDFVEAQMLAKMLDTENKNRQKVEAKILDEAFAKTEREVNFKYHNVIVLASENWHPGVIGIVSSRLMDKYRRPVILISLDGKLGKGSGRSVDGFHLFDCLFKCRDILVSFGGHEAACGITIEKDRIDEFRERINEEANKIIKDEMFAEKLSIDMEIPLNAINDKMLEEFDSLSPFGIDNPRPVFASKNLVVKEGVRKIGKNGFKFWVTDQRLTCEAVTFGKNGFDMPIAGSSVDLAYIPSINSWQGVESVQLELRDIKKSGE